MEQTQIYDVLVFRSEMVTDNVYSWWLFYYPGDSMLSTEDLAAPTCTGYSQAFRY